MKITQLLATAACLSLAGPGFPQTAPQVAIGGRNILLPSPEGYVLVTDQMPAQKKLAERLTPTGNVRLATFIPQEQAGRALAGKTASGLRVFWVEAGKEMLDYPATVAAFGTLKEVLRRENEKLQEKVRADSGMEMAKANERLRSDHRTTVQLSVSSLVPLPIHDESERSVSYSMYVKVEASHANRKEAADVAVETVSFALVKDRIISLHLKGAEDDLQWSRDAAKSWLRAVLDANAPDSAAQGPAAK